jgi:predicted kinase
VTLLSGLPGAGKDTWLAAHAGDMPVISLDDLRAELDIDPADGQGPVIAAAREQARIHLRAGRPFIWNATKISRQLRSQLIDLFADYKAKVRIVYVEAPLAGADRRNQNRARPVPRPAIERMLDRWKPTDLTECHALDIALT